MKILLVLATREEISPLLKNIRTFKNKTDILITGPGMISTTHHLTKKLNKIKYDLAINAGIAGSFLKTIPLGKIVQVKQECFSELGAEDAKDFIHITELKLNGEDDFLLRKKFFINKTKIRSKTFSLLPEAKGITVNTVHGNSARIEKVKKLFSPEVETMEGAAFFYVCEKEKIPFIQIRAISNYVERRNKSKWKIEEAISNLCKTLKIIIEELK